MTAVNQAGVTTDAPAATVFVDTVPPRATLRLSGTSIVNTREQLRVNYIDPPPAGLPKSAASGVSTVYVNWGDQSARARIRRTTASHVYTRIRTYTVTITLTDRAGNRTVIVHKLKIKAKPKPKKHKKGKRGRKASRPARGRSSACWRAGGLQSTPARLGRPAAPRSAGQRPTQAVPCARCGSVRRTTRHGPAVATVCAW